MIKKKTARRFLNRNAWKIAKQSVDGYPSKAFNKRVRLCREIIGDIRFKRF